MTVKTEAIVFNYVPFELFWKGIPISGVSVNTRVELNMQFYVLWHTGNVFKRA